MNDENDHFKIWIGSAIAVASFGVLWGGIAYCIDGLDNAAKFGDSFGAINSIFSSLAAAGAVYAVILQRKELRESRKAAEDSAKAQADLVKLQAQITIYSELMTNRDRAADRLHRLHEEADKESLKKKNPASTPGVLAEMGRQLERLGKLIAQEEKAYASLDEQVEGARKKVEYYLGNPKD